MTMNSSSLEHLQLQVAELQAQIARHFTRDNFRPGQRVTFTFGNSDELHARIERLTFDRTGEPAAVLVIAGNAHHAHVEPLANLRAVCGTCADCRALNQRPGCAA